MPEWTPPGGDDSFDQRPLDYPTDYPTGIPQGPPPRYNPSRTTGYVLLLSLVAIIVGYGFAVFLTRASWGTGEPRDGVRVTFTAYAPDGSSPSPAAMSETQRTAQSRVDDLGGAGSTIDVDGNQLIVSVPAADDGQVRELLQSGQLYIRPVIHSIPAKGSPTTATTLPRNSSEPPAELAKRIADEKTLRQSRDQQVQLLALQFQATRCGDADVLADNDDPTLPLVTCSRDGTTVYLLDGSIIGGRNIAGATSTFDDQLGEHVVNIEFDRDATTTWADFTAAHTGTQTAFTLDTRVISAPEINEAIPGGRTQVTGRFTADQARDFASALRHGALPSSLTFDSSKSITISPAPASTPLRVGLIVGAAGVASFTVFVLSYLIRHRRRPIANYLTAGNVPYQR